MSHDTLVVRNRPHPSPHEHVNDFDAFASLFMGWRGQFDQLTFGPFLGTMQTARGRNLQVHRATTNQALLVRGREPDGILTLALVTQRNARSLWQGRQLQAGQFVIRGGDVGADHYAARDSDSYQIAVHETYIRSRVQLETGRAVGPFSWSVVQSSPDTAGQFQNAIWRYLAGSGGECQDDSLEYFCLRAALKVLVPGDAIDAIELPLAARSRMVKRAEDIMRSRIHTAISEDDLCRELGVPSRTLRFAFRKLRGCGPLAFHQSLRLNAVRTRLKQLPADRSVAAIARQWGFHHLGKFAGYYRRLFGELPSETMAGVG
jgi:AraC family ethanolamine operon transcriptional activator